MRLIICKLKDTKFVICELKTELFICELKDAKFLTCKLRTKLITCKLKSARLFTFVYKIILHLILLLIKQHELMIFKSESNIIHKTDNDYTSTKHHFSTLSNKRMRRSEFKADELYIMIQSVRQISCDNKSVKK